MDFGTIHSHSCAQVSSYQLAGTADLAVGMGTIFDCDWTHVPVYLDFVLSVPQLHHEAKRGFAGSTVHLGGMDYLHRYFFLLHHQYQPVRCAVRFDQCHYDFDAVAVFDWYCLDFRI